MKPCIGIISWLPDKEPDRSQRIDRVNTLLNNLRILFKGIPILIIAQNWKDFTPKKISNKLIIKYFDKLGILGARKTLQQEFLKLDYDYIIMFDDDAIIKGTKEDIDDYLKLMNEHPNGFCFPTYAAAQLNLCAISKFIYTLEPFVDIDPQKSEGFEDKIYSELIHNKYSDLEFTVPNNIKCIQFKNKDYALPSTWSRDGKHDWKALMGNTKEIVEYIEKNKSLPDLRKYKKIIRKKEIKKVDREETTDMINYWLNMFKR